jgi:hypothetical protein
VDLIEVLPQATMNRGNDMKKMKKLLSSIIAITVLLFVSVFFNTPSLASAAIAEENVLPANANSYDLTSNIFSDNNRAMSASSIITVAAKNSPDKTSADYICDGAADQVEINAAMDALPDDGGIIVLLSGTFTFSSHIGLRPNTPITIEGQGSTTVLNWNSSVQKHPLICHMYKGHWVNLKDIQLRNFKIVDTNKRPRQSFGVMTGWVESSGDHSNILVDGLETVECGIWLGNVDFGEAIISNCYVHDLTVGDRGIGINNSVQGLIYGNRIENVYEMAIGCVGNTSLMIYDNYMKATGRGHKGFAIDTCTSTNVEIFNNTIELCRAGINSENSQGGINIHDNTFTADLNNRSIGIQVWRTTAKKPKAKDIVIANNIVNDAACGISLRDVDNAEVSYNQVNNSKGNGIQVMTDVKWGTGPTSILINGNDLFDFSHDVWQAGIAIIGADYVSISDNTLDGNGNAKSRGIYFKIKSASHSSITGNAISGVAYSLSEIPKDVHLIAD